MRTLGRMRMPSVPQGKNALVQQFTGDIRLTTLSHQAFKKWLKFSGLFEGIRIKLFLAG